MKSADVANPEMVIKALLKHIGERRTAIDNAWPKHLKKKAYAKLVGEHTELQRLETMIDDVVNKAKAADSEPEGDDQ